MWYDTFAAQFTKTFIEAGRYKLFLEGLGTTLIITICASVFGAILGVLIAMIKVLCTRTQKKSVWTRVTNGLCNIYLTVIRGTPMVVQLLIMYYIAFVSFRSALLVAIIAFSINSSAYVAEIARAGIMAIDIGQTEAGRSLGLSYTKTMWKIILPQAVKNILPALGNELITLFKDTSIASFITVVDFARAGALVRVKTMDPYFSLLSVAAVYLAFVMLLTFLLGKLERRLRKSDRN